MKTKPPKLSHWLLCIFRNRSDHESIIGDYEEVFEYYCEHYGAAQGKNWYRRQVLKSLPSFIVNSIYWRIIMLKSYLIISLRNYLKLRTNSLINTLGLAIGLACSILIILYAQNQLSYDTFHKDNDRIFRVVGNSINPYITFYRARTPNPLAPAMAREYREIETAGRLYKLLNPLITHENNSFFESKFFLADQGILDIFSFQFVTGNKNDALSEMNSVILTEETARKYFGGDNPIGKLITHENNTVLKVTAVVKSLPDNSHFKFDFIGDLQSIKTMNWLQYFESWSSGTYSYLKLKEGIAPETLEAKFPDFIEQYYRFDLGSDEDYEFLLQPLTDIHLNSQRDGEIEANGNIAIVYILGGIAFLILMIACINYMNLATSNISMRSKELCMRKVIGARRSQLIYQFLGESIVQTFAGFLLALLLVIIVLSIFNDLTSTNISFNPSNNKDLLFYFTALVLFVGLISGSYPAFLLSSFSPVAILRNTMMKSRTGYLRKILVLFQFSASIVLLISSFVIYDQLQYMLSKDVGYEKEGIAVFDLRGMGVANQYSTIKNNLLQIPTVVDATFSYQPPNNIGRHSTVSWEGSQGVREEMYVNFVDFDFIDTYGIEIKVGRKFSRDITTDLTEATIVNESFLRTTGMTDPIGKTFTRFGKNRKIIGVMGDFNFLTLHSPIEPVTFQIDPSFFQSLSLKLNPANVGVSIENVKQVLGNFSGGRPIEYYFLDSNYNKQYQSEEKLARTLKYFTYVAIFIACLGLYGLVSFGMGQRVKEIGIRKVLGCSLSGLSTHLTMDFVKPVIFANLIAWPVAYLLMERWIGNFAYHTDISISYFIYSGGLTFMLTLLTVLVKTIKAVNANPVESLKYE